MRKTLLACCLAPLAVALALPVQLLAAAPANITVQKPWIRYLLPNIPAGGYLTLVNTGDIPATLIGATSPACGTLMLHESVNMGGTAMMMAVTGVPVPAHGQAELVEGGYHLMCMQPKMKPGDEVPVTLSFAGGATMLVRVPVYGPAGAP